jgi:ligand-binding SRPBCC domain-containing protein
VGISIERHPSGRGRLLRTQVDVPRPLEATFAFFADAANLEAITPPWLRFRITNAPAARTLAVGSRISYRLRLHGIPISWDTHIAEWDAPHAFADEQDRGPYRWWRHRHTFEAIAPDSTRMRDEVWYQPPLGALSDRLLVARDVRRIFEYRERRLLELLG